MEVGGAGTGGTGFATPANRTGPAGRRPGQHFLKTARPMLIAGGPQRRRRRGQRCRRAADDFIEERRRELGQMGREKKGRRRFYRPEARTYPRGALGGWSEAPHGARWRRRRPYGGRRWRRDATQGRLTRLRPGTDRSGSRAGAPGAAAATATSGTLRHGVLRVGGATARRGALRIVPRGTRARRRGRRRGQGGRFYVTATSSTTAAAAATTAVSTLAFALLLLQSFTLTPFRPPILEPYLHSSFREINLHGQVFPRKDVRVVSLREGGLEFLQLLEGESCPVSALLPPHEGILADSVQCWVIGRITSIGVSWSERILQGWR